MGRTCGFNEIQRLHSFQGPRQHLKPNTGTNLTYSSLLIYNSGFTLVTFFFTFLWTRILSGTEEQSSEMFLKALGLKQE